MIQIWKNGKTIEYHRRRRSNRSSKCIHPCNSVVLMNALLKFLRYHSHFCKYLQNRRPFDRKMVHSTEDRSTENHFLSFSTFSRRSSSSVSQARFCALSRPFQNRWENWKFPTGSQVMAQNVEFQQTKLVILDLSRPFSTLSRPNSMSQMRF